MATPIFSQQEMYDLFITTLQSFAPDLTDTNEGSIIDSLGGVISVSMVELQKLVLDRFNKTFIETSNGPEVTGGADDLQTLAVDHFGADFARPAPAEAIGTVTFSRPTTGAGNITIPTGTVVKTTPDANGNVQRYATIADVTIIGTSINASIQALTAGSAGNAASGAVSVIESSLLDSTITVTNSLALAGGTDTMDDADYREFIRNKIEVLRGAAKSAVEAAALTVSGVVTATAVEPQTAVIPYDIGTNAPVAGAAWYYIPQVTVYIADANGTASSALIDAVKAAIDPVRAAGVRVDVEAASALIVNWTAAITLNPSGVNYATLSTDTTILKTAMANYINLLSIGTGFDKATAEAAILADWGPGGSNDLVTFSTTVPAASIAGVSTQKLIAGTMSTT